MALNLESIYSNKDKSNWKWIRIGIKLIKNHELLQPYLRMIETVSPGGTFVPQSEQKFEPLGKWAEQFPHLPMFNFTSNKIKP